MENTTSGNTVIKLSAGTLRQTDMNVCYWGRSEFTEATPMPPAQRDHFLMLYCTGGSGNVRTDGEEYILESGQFMLVFPNRIMSASCISKNPWQLTWVGLKGVFLSYYLQRMGITAANPVFPWRNSEFVLHELNKILKSENSDICSDFLCCTPEVSTTGGELERLSSVYSILSEAHRLCSDFAELNTYDSEQEDYIHKAMAFMEANFNRKIKISDVAKHVGLNRSYLFTLFKNNLNESPQEVLTRLRIRKACDLLRSNDATVSAVAYTLGYEPRALSRLFKQITGCTPTEYRQRELNSENNSTQ